MTRILLVIAAPCCEGKLVGALEGGYNPEAPKDSVAEVLREVAGRRMSEIQDLIAHLPTLKDRKCPLAGQRHAPEILEKLALVRNR